QPFRERRRADRATVADLMRALPEGAVVVDFLLAVDSRATLGGGADKGQSYYEAFVLRKAKGPPGYVVEWAHLGPAEPIERAVGQWRAAILKGEGGPSPTADPKLPQYVLRRLVWERLEPRLGGCRTVLILPDQALTRVPWAALPGPKPGTYL